MKIKMDIFIYMRVGENENNGDNMKKTIIIFIVLAALLALVACTKEKPNQPQSTKINVQQISPDKNMQSALA